MTIQWQGSSFSTSFISHSENAHRESMNIFQIQIYSSGFRLIDKAIQMISKNSLNSQVALKIFNDTIAGYKTVISPFPAISCLQDLQELEKRLENHSLNQFWDVLSSIIDEPQIKTVEQKREWFEDKKNQPLLDTIAILELQACGLISLPKEIYQLRNLKKLDLSQNQLEFLPESIKI
ncbi:MAG: hypothetical protein C5B45_03395 [Chlamydiae bacterium]|nr:MAG: hypothetical protein C5B45_03395 [Chlamydiota bacterium]